MKTINELIQAYKQGQIDFATVLVETPKLQWGTKHVEADGEIWWDGDNTVGDVDILWYESVITDDEREAIMEAILNK